MNLWTPMTSRMGDGWTYKYNENRIRGIKQTEQPSPWINDYGAFSLMAITGKLKYEEEAVEILANKLEDAYSYASDPLNGPEGTFYAFETAFAPGKRISDHLAVMVEIAP